MSQSTFFHRSINLTIFLIVSIAVCRFCSVFFPAFALQVDEAQYAGWGNHLAYGYYSKPPFIAWVLHLGQLSCDVLGIHHVEGCTRMLQSIALMIASLFVVATAWRLFANRTIAIVSGLLFITLPSVAFYSLLATTDPWLLMWWSMALFAFVIVMQSPMRWSPWILLGFSLGLGILAKYAMLAFLIGLVVGFMYLPSLRQPAVMLRLMLALLICIALLWPHYQWNAALGFPTITHHVDIAQVTDVSSGHWQLTQALQSLLTFIGGQLVVFGPLAFMALLVLFFSRQALSTQPLPQAITQVLRWGFVAPMLIIMCVEALISRAFANWALVSYVAASILVSAYWVKHWDRAAMLWLSGRQAFISSFVIGLLCSIAFIAVPHWVQSKTALADVNHNPFRRIHGWKDVALWAKDYVSQHDVAVAATDRYLLATIAKYSYPTIPTAYAWNPSRVIKNHYQQFYDVATVRNPEQVFLLLMVGQTSTAAQQQLQTSFLQIKHLHDPSLEKLKVGKYKMPVTAMIVSGFKGYSP